MSKSKLIKRFLIESTNELDLLNETEEVYFYDQFNTSNRRHET